MELEDRYRRYGPWCLAAGKQRRGAFQMTGKGQEK